MINRSKWHLRAVEAVAALLPADDGELDALIAETVRDKYQHGFIMLTVGALIRERKVDARHLAGGAMMLTERYLLGGIALHLQGEVPEPLLHAMEHTQLVPEAEVAGLLVIATWCKEHGDRAWPAGFIAHARTFARSCKLKPESMALLVMLAEVTGDEGLRVIVNRCFTSPDAEATRKAKAAGLRVAETFLANCRAPLQLMIPKEAPKVLAEGFTMRRAVARIGRNEPCPCRSGKKYKHCCIAKDKERLHFSTDVAGKSMEELNAEPEPYLTLEKMKKAPVHEVASWDPRKLKPELLEDYFNGLRFFHLLDRAVEAFELLGWSAALEESWDAIAFTLARSERGDLASRLMKVRPDAATVGDDLQLAMVLMLAKDDPARMIKAVEERALRALRSGNEKELCAFAHALLVSPFRGLGIFVARSMMSVLTQENASLLFERLLETRDKLNLPPDDPFGEILDERFRKDDAGESKEADALREAQRRLDAKAKEVGLLKEALDRLHKEVQQREQAPPPIMAVATPVPAPVDEPVLRELRRKVENLKAALNERHAERNELRRHLQKAHAELELLHQKAPKAEPKSPEERDSAREEEELFMPAEPFINQPVRIIEFPKRFQEGLVSLPRSVGRGTLTMLGRLAAGEPAAFVGVVRLKICHGIYRQRIGIDFRLLFKLLPDRVLVVDLVPKQDLLRRIKTLQ